MKLRATACGTAALVLGLLAIASAHAQPYPSYPPPPYPPYAPPPPYGAYGPPPVYAANVQAAREISPLGQFTWYLGQLDDADFDALQSGPYSDPARDPLSKDQESAKARRAFRLGTAKSANRRAGLYGWCWPWRTFGASDAASRARRCFMNFWNSAG